MYENDGDLSKGEPSHHPETSQWIKVFSECNSVFTSFNDEAFSPVGSVKDRDDRLTF